jgi:AraC-like DNA-binding protein
MAGRVWEVNFEIPARLPSLPYPGAVVEEVQQVPEYNIQCRTRKNMTGCQLSCTLEGEGIFRYKRQEYRLTPGMAFLQNHNDVNTAYYYPVNGRQPWRFLWFAFFSETVESMVREMVSRYGYIYRLPVDGGIVKKLKSFKSYRGTLQILSPLEAARVVMDILTGLDKHIEEKYVETSQSNLIRRTQAYIFENIGNDIGIDQIARDIGVSREHLARIFRQQLGQAPLEYLMKRKMELACKLLISTNLTCKEIAERIGYENSVSFNRAFKNLVKMPPGQLRELGYVPEIR